MEHQPPVFKMSPLSTLEFPTHKCSYFHEAKGYQRHVFQPPHYIEEESKAQGGMTDQDPTDEVGHS